MRKEHGTARRGGSKTKKPYKLPKIRTITWNAQSLGFGNSETEKKNQAYVAKELKRADFMAIIESHGTGAELRRWAAEWSFSHDFFASPGPTHRKGGVVTVAAKSWLKTHEATITFEDVIKGRVCALRISPRRAARIYLLTVHNFDLKEGIGVVMSKQAELAHWARAAAGNPGVGLIGGDFNFSPAGAAIWKIERGPTVVAVPESDSDRSARKKWAPLISRVLDVTRHDEPTHTSAAQANLGTQGSQCLGSAAVLDHTYVDIEQWQHQFTRTKAGPLLSPFQAKARGISDHSFPPPIGSGRMCSPRLRRPFRAAGPLCACRRRADAIVR